MHLSRTKCLVTSQDHLATTKTMGTSGHLCITAQAGETHWRKLMKWLTRDLARELLLRFPPPPPQLRLLSCRTYSSPEIQGNLAKLYIIKACSLQNLKILVLRYTFLYILYFVQTLQQIINVNSFIARLHMFSFLQVTNYIKLEYLCYTNEVFHTPHVNNHR